MSGLLGGFTGCAAVKAGEEALGVGRIQRQHFGSLSNGQDIETYLLTNQKGMSAKIMTLGAGVVSLNVPDRRGEPGDVVLGFDEPGSYIEQGGYFGVVLGRYANRIAGGRFALDGRDYTLPINSGPNHLHGGPVGFDKRIWSAQPMADESWCGLALTLVSPDGDQGYPGALFATVEYRLDNENCLTVEYSARCDRPTIVNLSQHSYFNLEGHSNGSALDHQLELNADFYTPIDVHGVPTGQIVPVDGTVMDFRGAKRIGRDIGLADEQLQRGNGFDHNWVLNENPQAGGLVKAAQLYAPVSGRTMTVHTNKPGIQFYSANFLRGQTGKGGAIYRARDGICLETQFFPDSPNNPQFPSARLDPGATYNFVTRFAFGSDNADTMRSA